MRSTKGLSLRRSKLKPFLWVITVSVLAFGSLELGTRAIGALDFPLYVADSRIGYIPAPSQSGMFLRRNYWHFNSLSMGAGEFRPSMKMRDILLLGDSIVLGGNHLKENERLGPNLGDQTSSHVWPVSAASWSLRNELLYVKLHPHVANDVDEFVFVLNSGDFGEASSWACEWTHPRRPPMLAAIYLFQKYILKECPPVESSRRVATGDWKLELARFVAQADSLGKPVHVFLYPTRSELLDRRRMQDDLLSHVPELRAAGVRSLHLIADYSEWQATFYRDDIHPSAEGTQILAAVMSRALAEDWAGHNSRIQ